MDYAASLTTAGATERAQVMQRDRTFVSGFYTNDNEFRCKTKNNASVI